MKKPQAGILQIIFLLAVGVCGFFINVLVQESEYVWAGVVGIVGVALAFLELRGVGKPRSLFEDDKLTLRKSTIKTLVSEGSLQRVKNALEVLNGQIEYDRRDDLRITVHLAFRRNDCEDCHGQDEWSFLQLTDYVGDYRAPPPRGRYRVFPVTKGLIGRCFRTNERHTVNFDDAQTYRDQMVEEFGYDRAEAERDRNQERRSYLCWPMGGRPMAGQEAILGLIYVDSRKFRFFPDIASEVQNEDAFERAADSVIAALEGDPLVRAARTS